MHRTTASSPAVILTSMDRGEICDKFLDSVSYELYPFQEEALLAWFESEGGVLVAAPTGMGKTLVAEAAIFEALHSGQRLYYTTPLIALTDQKFREFQDKAEEWGFPRDAVGLITGNRRVNPDALVRVVVAEILLNHLLAGDEMVAGVSGVVMDEFHYFNDFERGIVWELSLTLLDPHVRLMLLSATVGNSVEFVKWVREQHARKLSLVQSDERRVPLEFTWVGEKLLTEHLPEMVSANDESNRSPALVFCFNRDECWEVAERLKGAKLINQAVRDEIEAYLGKDKLVEGIGPKLRQMLIRGVGVHHAGILPKHKEIVEHLFLRKLIPFVVCTETLAAGVNLPARSVVLSTLLKGKPREKKLVFGSAAHQMFGRAGRPQFDRTGYVYALAHDDDVKIAKWRKRYDQIDPNSKDPGIMRARKELERKKPSRRKTEQYWTEGQFQSVIKAGPANLSSRSMIPYRVLLFLLQRSGSLKDVRAFLSKRFNSAERLAKFQDQLDHMVDNLACFGYLTRGEVEDQVVVHDNIEELYHFRSIDPLYGAFLGRHLARGDSTEKMLALESVLSMPPAVGRQIRIPEHIQPGPAQRDVIEPALLQMGIAITGAEGGLIIPDADRGADHWEDPEEPHPLTFPEMLKALFDAKLKTPEAIEVQPKWVAGGIAEMKGEFYKFTGSHNLAKNEGLVYRHVLRFASLALEFLELSGGDPEFSQLSEEATRVCQQIDPTYTDRFLAAEQEARQLSAI